MIMNKIESYLKKRKNLNSFSNEEILDNLKFKFIRDFYENDINEENIINLIERIKRENQYKNIRYYSLIHFENIYFKYINIKIFYYIDENKLIHLYISSNILDRFFRNEKIILESEKELKKILFKYHIQNKKKEMESQK